METSKLEQLLEALVNGETVDITPSSRHEEYLLALLKGETVDKIPQSRLEVYLKKLCEIGLGDGTSVEAVLQALEVTKNGNYTPARGVDGFKSVTVNVPEPVLQPLDIIENGVYTPGDGVDGYNEITVSVLEQPTELVLKRDNLGEFVSTPDLGGMYGVAIPPVTAGWGYDITLGEEYLVIWDGKPYVTTARDASSLVPNGVYLGNGTGFNLEGNDEPFIISTYYQDYVIVIGLFDPTPYHSVKISKIVKPEPVLQDKTITENGTYTADEGYDGLGEVTVEVNATGGGEDYLSQLIDGSITECSADVEVINQYAFTSCYSLRSISFPKCKDINAVAFANCYSLTTADFPVCSVVRPRAFEWCSGLTTANFPLCTTIYGSAFQRCTVLSNVNFPACELIGSYAFASCYSGFSEIRLPACTTISYGAFNYCSKLTSIYLTANSVCSLNMSNVFTATSIKSSMGSIFVPASLVDAYKSATNWAYFSNRIFSAE